MSRASDLEGDPIEGIVNTIVELGNKFSDDIDEILKTKDKASYVIDRTYLARLASTMRAMTMQFKQFNEDIKKVRDLAKELEKTYGVDNQ